MRLQREKELGIGGVCVGVGMNECATARRAAAGGEKGSRHPVLCPFVMGLLASIRARLQRDMLAAAAPARTRQGFACQGGLA